MKLVLAWLVAMTMSVASADAIYNLTAEFPADCAIFCTEGTSAPSRCDFNDVACYCRSPDFLSNTGCCISHVCQEDIDHVKNTLSDWCSAASAQLASADSTNCSAWNSDPWGTGASSNPSPASSSSPAESTDENHKFSDWKIAGIALGCLGVVILASFVALFCWQCCCGGKKRSRPSAAYTLPPRGNTPPPAYSETDPRSHRPKPALLVVRADPRALS